MGSLRTANDFGDQRWRIVEVKALIDDLIDDEANRVHQRLVLQREIALKLIHQERLRRGAIAWDSLNCPSDGVLKFGVHLPACPSSLSHGRTAMPVLGIMYWNNATFVAISQAID
jgi:hypothetical protein